jgi:hypothetical protein
MPRIAITSDLHFDVTGELTSPDEVLRVAEQIRESHPDAAVLAGDIGHPLDNFRLCLDVLAPRCRRMGVIPGNHDVWRDRQFGSKELWERVLPEETTNRGLSWIEEEPIVVERVAIVGSMAWYDYSAAQALLGKDAAYYERIKPRLSNDAHWIEWPWSDVAIAAILRERLVARLERCERDPAIERVVVVTHVPVFAQQIGCDASDIARALASAFFGNLQTGAAIARFRKLRAVVSGHMHLGVRVRLCRTRMPDIHVCVVGSDYGCPTWVMLEI